MEERKKCLSCSKFLIAYNGLFLHPESPCNGLLDYIYIEAQIEDEFLHEKFEKLYGKPTLNDYERIELLEQEIEDLKVQIGIQDRLLNKPIIKLFNKFFRNK